MRPHRRQPTRLLCPWDSPGKNTAVGCHFLLQCIKVKSESEVAQSCLTLSDLMDCSPPGSSVHGILQARVVEWGVIAFSGWVGDVGPIPGLGRSPGDGDGIPLQYSFCFFFLNLNHPLIYSGYESFIRCVYNKCILLLYRFVYTLLMTSFNKQKILILIKFNFPFFLCDSIKNTSLLVYWNRLDFCTLFSYPVFILT